MKPVKADGSSIPGRLLRRTRGGRIDRQRGAVTKRRLQSSDRANLVFVAASDATHAKGANHLAVDHDGDAPGNRVQIKKPRVAREAARIVLELVCANRRRLARFQGSLSLKESAMHAIGNFTVHALHV